MTMKCSKCSLSSHKAFRYFDISGKVLAAHTDHSMQQSKQLNRVETKELSEGVFLEK